MVLDGFGKPTGNEALFQLSSRFARIEMVVEDDRDTAGVPRDSMEGVDQVLIREAAV